MPIVKITKNYLYDYIMTLFVANNKRPDPETGDPTKPVILMGGGSRCFEKDTLVKTDNGEKKISELEKGDLVLSFNHKNNKKEFKQVLAVIHNDCNIKRCYKIKFKNGDEIKCTYDHEMYYDGDYSTPLEFEKLLDRKIFKKISDGIDLSDILSIEEIELFNTYDLTVQDNSNYYLSANGGTLVHNSGKTVTAAQVLLTFMENYADPKAKNKKKLYIIVYRNTSVDSRKTFKDFIEEYDRIGLLPVEQRRNEKTGKFEMTGDYEKVESPKPIIRYKGHTIEFMGMPEGGQEAVGCDIAFINEILENKNDHAFYSIVRRTTIMTLADWNPKESVHYIYGIKRYNFHYPVTTYLDNKWLPLGQKADAEAQCPWEFNESIFEVEISDEYGNLKRYKVPEGFTLEKWYAGYYQSDEAPIKFNGFLRRKWLKEERPENCKEEDYHLYRTPNKLNHENGTVNRAEWLTYGEGIPSGQEGAIFKNVKWVDKFPDEVDNCYFGLDFGFSNDPSALVKCGNIGMDMYMEKLCYQKTGTSDLLFDLITKPLLNEEKRRYIEANSEEWYKKLCDLRAELSSKYSVVYSSNDAKMDAIDAANEKLQEHIDNGLPIEPIYVVTDTADVYKGRGAMVEQQFVIDLNMLAQQNGYDWKFIKVGSKPIVPRIALMKKFNLFAVKDKDFEIEQQNYCFVKDDSGNLTNLPDKDSKFNHIWDAAAYCIWKFFKYMFGS